MRASSEPSKSTRRTTESLPHGVGLVDEHRGDLAIDGLEVRPSGSNAERTAWNTGLRR